MLRSPLEVKYALVAREMLQGTSPLLVPHLFGVMYADKPPLYFWVTAAVGRLTGMGVTELTARLPAAIAAAAGVLLILRLGSDLFGPRGGLLSAAVLATSNLYFWYARQGHPDQFLTAFVTLACLALWRSWEARTARRSIGWAMVGYGAMACGVLSKGLLGLLIPLFAASTYCLLTGPTRAVPRRLHLHPGLWVFLGVVLAWYGPAATRHGGQYVYETLVHQHLARYVHGWVHRAPWYRYLGDFPVGFLPWTFFLPGAVALAWRAVRAVAVDSPDDRVEPRPAPNGRRPILFPLGWFVVGFLFLSLSSTKRDVYLLPLYPAAALMTGAFWERALSTPARSRWIGIPLGLWGVATVGLAGSLLLLPRGWIDRNVDPASRIATLIPADAWSGAAILLVVVAGAAGARWAWRRDRRGLVFTILVAVQATLLLSVAAIRAPQYEALYPMRALLARADALMPPDRGILTTLRLHSLLAAFYSHRPTRFYAGVPELLAARASALETQYALVDVSDRLRADGVIVLEEMRFGRDRVALIRVDPPPR